MSYILGSGSKRRLEGVHPDLTRVVKSAIEITEIDFTVLEGVRSVERQKRLVASGASKTMNSRHITGHAVDLGAWVDGRVAWDWPLYYKIATAMRQAAKYENVPVEWGGVWTLLNSTEKPTDVLVAEYTQRCRDHSISAFIDGPHYQLPWSRYGK